MSRFPFAGAASRPPLLPIPLLILLPIPLPLPIILVIVVLILIFILVIACAVLLAPRDEPTYERESTMVKG